MLRVEKGPAAVYVYEEAKGFPEADPGRVVGVDHGINSGGADRSGSVDRGQYEAARDARYDVTGRIRYTAA